MPQSIVLIPQKVTVLPDVEVSLTAPDACSFSIVDPHIPGGGVISANGANGCKVKGSTSGAEWGYLTVKGELADGNFGLCEIRFLVPFTVSPAS